MVALSALVFALSWWLGLYLLARDPRKVVLVLASIGLTSFAVVVALDAVRLVSASELLSRIEIYLVAIPGIAWFAVLLELSRRRDTWRGRAGEFTLVACVAAVAFAGAKMAGDVGGPLRAGHWVMFAAASVPTLGAMIYTVMRRSQPGPVAGFIVVATLFFALGNAILIIPLGLVPSGLALAATVGGPFGFYSLRRRNRLMEWSASLRNTRVARGRVGRMLLIRFGRLIECQMSRAANTA